MRHDDVALLQQLQTMPLVVERALATPLKPSLHGSHADALQGRSPVKELTLLKGVCGGGACVVHSDGLCCFACTPIGCAPCTFGGIVHVSINACGVLCACVHATYQHAPTPPPDYQGSEQRCSSPHLPSRTFPATPSRTGPW